MNFSSNIKLSTPKKIIINNKQSSCNIIQDLDSSQNYLKKLPVYKN